MGRAPCCDKENVKKGPWSPEEDAKLKSYIQENGTGGNWIALPQKMGLRRCGKSCRLRWLNYLRPNLKHGGFTEEEDNIICSLYISIGSRWSIIAAQLPGRTDNDIKNYWNTKLKKKLLGRRKQSRQLQIQEDDSISSTFNLSDSALERLQLHLHLQNPLSPYYNNPSLWPKLMMIPNQNNNNTIPDLLPQENYSSSLKEEEFVNCFTESEGNNGISGFTEAEIDHLLNNTSSSTTSVTTNDQMADQFDCFKEDHMNNNNNNVAWWSTQFVDVNSASPTSWDSMHMQQQQLHQSQDMYGIAGYSMQ